MDIADIRRQYGTDQLSHEQLAKHPMDQFEHWLDQAIDSKLFKDPTAMSIATVDAAGMPSSRIVLLKQYDQQGFVFYTNLGSNKAQDIQHNHQVCLHFAWLGLDRQVIVRGVAEKLSIAQVTQYFLSRPQDSKLAAWASEQSKPIATRQLLEQAFSQMKNKFSKGAVPLPSFWGGYRVKPVSIEFWQGRENRLHDRFIYRADEQAGFTIERLQP
ncbi:MAG: pyridoxamine 5'-phosphate oxidase [Bermanella sp.]